MHTLYILYVCVCALVTNWRCTRSRRPYVVVYIRDVCTFIAHGTYVYTRRRYAHVISYSEGVQLSSRRGKESPYSATSVRVRIYVGVRIIYCIYTCMYIVRMYYVCMVVYIIYIYCIVCTCVYALLIQRRVRIDYRRTQTLVGAYSLRSPWRAHVVAALLQQCSFVIIW